MNKVMRSLAFKMGLSIVLGEMLAVVIVGVIYIQHVSAATIFVWLSIVAVTSVLVMFLMKVLVLRRVDRLVSVAQQARAEELAQSVQLQAIIDVGGTMASLRDFDTLFNEVPHLISERFGFYYVGIFSDLTGFPKPVRSEGIVGAVMATHEARIALDVGVDAVDFGNSDLPDTRSEIALPLMIAGRVLGVLDIQSTEEAAFTPADARVLRGLADQVAVALDNAHIIAEMREALAAQQRADGAPSRDGDIGQQAWAELTRSQSLGYVSVEAGQVQPALSQWSPGMVQARREGRMVQEDALTVAVPVKVRRGATGVLGVVKFRRPEGAGAWTPQQLTLLETLTDRLSQAMESARLYEDSQRLAAQERLVGNVSSRIRESLEIEAVLQVAAREIGEAFDLSDIVIRLGTVEELVGPSGSVAQASQPDTEDLVDAGTRGTRVSMGKRGE